MNWKVIVTSQASKFEKPFERVIAQFEWLINAEDFVEMLKSQNKGSSGRIRIEHIDK